MGELTNISSYGEFKQQMDTVLKTTVENFVKTGYLLKVARDTSILEESGYKTVTEFAQAEYGLNATQVSRFIHINDRFSEGGYSDVLQEKYQGFGYAKLTIMLQIPDYIAEELSPEYTKAEVQAVKEEYQEEMKVTDIERMTEEPETFEERVGTIKDERLKLLCTVILQLGHDSPGMYTEIAFARAEVDAVKDIMAPNEEKIYNIRVKGMGRMMLAISENAIHLVNTRTGDKKAYFWPELAQAWEVAGVLEGADGKEAYRLAYGEEPEIAPVQSNSKVQKAEPKKKEEKKEKPKPRKEEKKKEDEVSADRRRDEDTAASIEEPAENRKERTEPEVAEETDTEEKSTDLEEECPEQPEECPEQPEECPEALTGEVIEAAVRDNTQKEMTRKEYLDGLTEFGAAQYINREYLAGRLQSGMLVYTAQLEKWLSEPVDKNGIGKEDMIKEEEIEGQIKIEDILGGDSE